MVGMARLRGSGPDGIATERRSHAAHSLRPKSQIIAIKPAASATAPMPAKITMSNNPSVQAKVGAMPPSKLIFASEQENDGHQTRREAQSTDCHDDQDDRYGRSHV